MRNIKSKKVKQGNKTLVQKFITCKNDFEYICKMLDIDPKTTDPKEILEYIVIDCNDFINAYMCDHYMLEDEIVERGKHIMGRGKFNMSFAHDLVNINLKVEKGDINVNKQNAKCMNNLYMANVIKRTFDSSIDPNNVTEDNHFTVPKKTDLQYVKHSEKHKEMSNLITTLTDSTRNLRDNTLPAYYRYLNAMIYLLDGTIDNKDARQIMDYKHESNGTWKTPNPPMKRLADNIANTYKLISKNNLNFHNHESDELQYWLRLHGLKLVEVEDFDDAENRYREALNNCRTSDKKEVDIRHLLEYLENIIYPDSPMNTHFYEDKY